MPRFRLENNIRVVSNLSTWNIRYITGAPTELVQRKLEMMIVEAKTY